MKKLLYIFLFIPIFANAQWTNVGNSTLQRTADTKKYRFNMGSLGNIVFPLFTQLDSIAALKQPIGNYITAVTGDITATGPGSVAGTLATVNSNVGTFGDASHTGQVTLNAKGLTTGGVSVAIQIAESQVTSLVSDLSNLTNGLATTNSNVSTISSGYANRSASQTFTGVPTFANGINTSATSNYNYPSTGNYYTAGGNQFALSGGGIAWQGGASIQNAGSGNTIIYNNGAAGHTFQVGATNYLQIYSTGSGPAVGNILASVTLQDNISIAAQHFGGYGTLPTIVPNTAAGSGATASLSATSTDVAGTISLTTGTGGTAGTQCTITFAVGYTTAPHVTISVNGGSGITLPNTQVYPGKFTTTLTLVTNSALTASSTYSIDYICMQ